MEKAKKIAARMLAADAYSQWLGIEILEIGSGHCKVGMTIRKEMLNSMQKAHGGITFSLADTCFAFATNSYGKMAVSVEASVNHIEALDQGDYITAETLLDRPKNKLGFTVIEIKKEEVLVALFKGVVYRSSKDW